MLDYPIRFLNTIKNHQKSSLEPCETTEVDTGSGSTGGGSGTTNGEEQEQPVGSGINGGNTNGDYSGGGTAECHWEVVEESQKCHEPGEGGSCDGPTTTYILVIHCPETKSSSDCFDASGLYGINLYEYAEYKLEAYNFTTNQWEWLTKEENQYFMMELYSCGVSQDFSPEAENFSLEAVDAKMAGGDVDWEDPLENYDFSEESTDILAFEQDYRAGMSNLEQSIFDNLSRLKQLNYLHSGLLAKTYAEIYYEPQTLYNGIGDSYRHALWNAIATVKLGENLTEQLTSAHEDRTPRYSYEYKEVEMDLFNNEVGREIGNGSSLMLMMKVKFALENGDLRYLNNLNSLNNRATSNSYLIPTAQ